VSLRALIESGALGLEGLVLKGEALRVYPTSPVALGTLRPGSNSPLTTAWKDLSGHGNDGVLTSMAGTTASGWAGSGTTNDPYRLVLDGVDDKVVCPAVHAFDGAAFSYESWAAFTSPDNVEILSEGSTSGAYCLIEVVTGGAVRLQSAIGGGSAGVTNPATTNDGLWHHYGASWDGSLMRFYVDGVSVGTPKAIASGTRTTNNTTIGYLPDWGHFGGSIPAARIYPFALSPTEIAAQYAAGPNAKAPTAGAVLELVAALAVPQALTYTNYAMVAATYAATAAGSNVVYQRSGTSSPIIVTPTAKSAAWQTGVVGAWSDQVRLFRDFCAVGDLLIPLDRDSVAYLRVA
jgi:hypothetical protein